VQNIPPSHASLHSTLTSLNHSSYQTLIKSQLEKKKLEYEFLKEQRRRFQTEMELIDLQAENSKDEMMRLSSEVSHRYSMPGHQSEPTTPPEYREDAFQEKGFPSALSRPNRFSASNLTSPPGLQTSSNRASRSGSQVMNSPFHSHKPAKSVPGTRRNSDEDDEEGYEFEIANVNTNRSAAS